MQLRKIAEAITPADIAALIRDKYDGNRDADISEDLKRLTSGEPLAYVIGWIPFLDLRIYFDTSESAVLNGTSTRPLIPRPETEWWSEKLIAHLKYKFENRPFKLLDLCAGSGAIGLAVIKAIPNASVSFGEIEPEFGGLIRRNLQENGLDEHRASVRVGDLFAPFKGERFDMIVTNPPYIPEGREAHLERSVTDFEPSNALYSGIDGLDLINRISKEVREYLEHEGELWMECDITNIGAAEKSLQDTTSKDFSATPETTVYIDQYGRPRLLIAQFP